MTVPFWKTAGGKKRLQEDIRSIFPGRCHGVYHEPFVGGGVVLLERLKAGEVKEAYASDANPYLIACWRAIQLDPDGVADALEAGWRTMPTKEQYYAERNQFRLQDPSSTDPADVARTIRINKTCFNGLFRMGPNGFNVPIGSYKTVNFPTRDHLRSLSKLIQRVVFRCCGFEKAFELVGPGEQVYADPPYDSEDGSSFVSYVLASWDGDASQEKLAVVSAEAAARGAFVVLTNHATDKVLTSFYPAPLFRHVAVHDVQRSVGAKTRGTAREILMSIG